MALRLSPEEIFRQLADGFVSAGALDFFSQLAERLALLLEMDHVVIGEILESAEQVRTLAVWSGGAIAENFIYDLAGTPCAELFGTQLCLYEGDLGRRFPDDPVISALGAQSYVGLPLVSRDYRHIGILALLRNAPTSLPDTALEALRIAAAQAGAELDRQRTEQAVRESERRLNTLMNHLPGMAYQCCNDSQWAMQFVSQGAALLTGYPAERLYGENALPFSDLIHPADRGRIFDEVQAAIARRVPYRLTYRLRTAAGAWRWMWEQGQAICDADGEVARLEGFITDITKQHQAHQWQQAVVQISLAATSATGVDFFKRLVHHLVVALGASAGFIGTLAWRGGETVLDTQAMVIAGELQPNTIIPLTGNAYGEVIDAGECAVLEGERISLPQNGLAPLVFPSFIGRRLDNSEGEAVGMLMVFFDSSIEEVEFPRSVLRILAAEAVAQLERQKHDRRIHQLAYYDGTTGQLNRAGFMEALQAALVTAQAHGTAVGMLILDLRRFKEINDTHGHEVGDLLLAAVAARFAAALEGSPALARLASDEFALVLPDVTVAELEAVGATLRATLQPPVLLDDREFNVEVSVGAAHFPGDTPVAEELFQHASIALYHAKQSQDSAGSRFTPAMVDALHRRQQMIERFTRALQQGELLLHYQPQFDLRNGRLMGAEALCRWHDSQWGWVSPAEFIPLAEERGLMRRLGEWVLGQGCSQLRSWAASGLPLPPRLSINVSAQQFDNLQLAGQIAELAEGLPRGCIGLELTESSLMRDAAQAVGVTQALQAAGFGISIDDFGTGYSSLSYLKRFAADTLKIDKSFIQDMLNDPHDLAIVTTIIAMAHSLGMHTVAEGVETADQARHLAELGCEQVQGFFFGRPLAPADFAEAWLRPQAAVPDGRLVGVPER